MRSPTSARRPRSVLVRAATVVTAALGLVAIGQPVANAYPPDPPPASEAATMLAGLTVEAEGSMDGYSRDLFPHWNDQGNNCDTRDVVLQRDGTDVQVDSDCEPTSGSWYSVYDAQWVDSDADVQIDHIVALAEAWRSGANEWTTDHRSEFANDLSISALIAVSGTSNSEKSDYDPSEWTPANTSVHCIYAREWIWVKSTYGLGVDEPEKAALESLLGTC